MKNEMEFDGESDLAIYIYINYIYKDEGDGTQIWKPIPLHTPECVDQCEKLCWNP